MRRAPARSSLQPGASTVAEAAERPSEPFAMFPLEVANALRQSAVHRCWRDGDVVLPADRVVPWILTVVRGKLRMAATLGDGREATTTALRKRNGFPFEIPPCRRTP